MAKKQIGKKLWYGFREAFRFPLLVGLLTIVLIGLLGKNALIPILFVELNLMFRNTKPKEAPNSSQA